MKSAGDLMNLSFSGIVLPVICTGKSGDPRPLVRMAIVIASDNDRGTMSSNYAVVITIMLISAMSLAGCTGSPPVPLATPSPGSVPSPLVSTPAPAGMAAPAGTSAAWTTETPATGRPYSKMYTFTATGDYDEHTFTTEIDRTWVFRLTYPDQGDFIVILKNDRGEDIAVLAREGESSTGPKSVWLKAGNYYFDIAADAPWTITMSTA